MYYAQINELNICYAVTQTTGEVIQADMILVESLDESLLDKKYNPETQLFEEVTM